MDKTNRRHLIFGGRIILEVPPMNHAGRSGLKFYYPPKTHILPQYYDFLHLQGSFEVLQPHSPDSMV